MTTITEDNWKEGIDNILDKEVDLLEMMTDNEYDAEKVRIASGQALRSDLIDFINQQRQEAVRAFAEEIKMEELNDKEFLGWPRQEFVDAADGGDFVLLREFDTHNELVKEFNNKIQQALEVFEGK